MKENYEEFREKANMHNRNNISKNAEMWKAQNKTIKQKSRQKYSSNERLKEFLKSTMYNAVFVCICCRIRCFKSNVTKFSEKLKQDLNDKYPEILEFCIGNHKQPSSFETVHENEKWKSIYGKNAQAFETEYVCNTCLKYLRQNKMPPMCMKNGLKLTETEQSIKDQGLWLTELEGSMIARRIVFLKVFLLPKSRWTAFKDKAVNVPIPESSILNTVELLPRTPQNAGLVSVSLKRKIVFWVIFL